MEKETTKSNAAPETTVPGVNPYNVFDGGKTPEQIAASEGPMQPTQEQKPEEESEEEAAEEVYPKEQDGFKKSEEGSGTAAVETIANPTNHGGICIIKEKAAELINTIESVATSLGVDYAHAKTKILEAVLSIAGMVKG